MNGRRGFAGGVALLAGCMAFQAHAGPPSGAAYLDGSASRVGVILCHGRGKHPTWKVVNPLRKGIHDRLGYHTLSLQMPVRRQDWRAYAEDFPSAHRAIAAGIAFLRNEKGVERIFLLGHSMGSRMATSFLASNPTAPIAGFVGVGVRNGGGRPLDSNGNLRGVSIPVLDVFGDGGDGVDKRHAAARADMVSARYRQALIPGASHTFDEHEDQLVEVVTHWLASRSPAVE